MKPENRVLDLVKKKPMFVGELQKKLLLSTSGMISVFAFLEKYKLVETMVSAKHELMAKITPEGLQLLNLPDLPEDELASDQLEVLERYWGDKLDDSLKAQEADREDYEKQIDGAVEEGEFSEATINSIKAREDKRQREIAGVRK